ncbi:MAG: hypothetical protein K8T10_11140 [Candidatus Eremiobacteraeota bacterium]|nr:hypothetical protein [Candidatus Eremiobacteraeota bacterium]
MEALLTWKYFLIPGEKFDAIKSEADELDSLRNRELTEKESARKDELIDIIDLKAKDVAEEVVVYKDDGEGKDGTIVEELVYRMDDSPELRKYREQDEFYFQFMVYCTPEGLQKQYDKIKKIFAITKDHNLLKEEFLGKWVYLERAREIFHEIRKMFQTANDDHCGIVKIDRVEWVPGSEEVEELEEDIEDKEEEILEDVDADTIDA